MASDCARSAGPAGLSGSHGLNGPIGPCWAPLGPAGPRWAPLGPVGPRRAAPRAACLLRTSPRGEAEGLAANVAETFVGLKSVSDEAALALSSRGERFIDGVLKLLEFSQTASESDSQNDNVIQFQKNQKFALKPSSFRCDVFETYNFEPPIRTLLYWCTLIKTPSRSFKMLFPMFARHPSMH